MTRQPLYLMRPKTRIPPLDRYSGPLPEGWHWQAKIDDERGIIVADLGAMIRIYNRHWEPLAAHKAPAFLKAAEKLCATFPEQRVFDVALLGFRGHWPAGGIVLLDLPELGLVWRERYGVIWEAFEEWDPLAYDGEPNPKPPGPGEVAVLPAGADCTPEQVRELFKYTRDIPGVEGLIGRDPGAYYQPGDSDRMVKIRWK